MSPKLSKRIELTCGKNWSGLTQPEGTCGDGDGYSAVANTNTGTNTAANITTTNSTDASAEKSACLQALAEMCRQVGNNKFNVYNMYDTCFPDNGLSFSQIRRRLRRRSVGMTGPTQPANAFHTHPALYATGDAAASPAPQVRGNFDIIMTHHYWARSPASSRAPSQPTQHTPCDVLYFVPILIGFGC